MQGHYRATNSDDYSFGSDISLTRKAGTAIGSQISERD